VAIDERLHADLDLTLHPIERGLERVFALRQELSQLGFVPIDGAETTRHDRPIAEDAVEHLLVCADLLLEPSRVGETLRKRRLVELLE
jgi:hypothetical protein